MICPVSRDLHNHLMECDLQDAISEEADSIWHNLDRHELLEMLTDADAYEKVVVAVCHWITCPQDTKTNAANDLVDAVFESVEDKLRADAQLNLENNCD